MVYSGMGPDFRLLVRKARKLAQQYYLKYQESIPVSQLVQKVATVMQEYTQSGWVGVGGVCMFVCVCVCVCMGGDGCGCVWVGGGVSSECVSQVSLLCQRD